MEGVSLIICTYNGSQRLALTLQYIAELQVKPHIPWEVLIISNASTDNTVEAAKEIWERIGVQVPFRVETESKPGKENALIKGLQLAQYEFVSIVDDDNWLSPDYVNIAFEVMSAHASIGILGTRAIGQYEITPPEWFQNFEAVYAIGPQNNGVSGPLKFEAGYVYGAGSVVRKSAWEKLRQHYFEFNTSAKRGKVLSGGEDLELCHAMQLAGYDLWYDDRLTFIHYMYQERLNWEYLLKLGKSTATSSLTTIVYYFVFRYPDLSEKKFIYLYYKRIIWVILQIKKKPVALFHYMFRTEQEGYTDSFEMLRLINNFKTSLFRKKQALDIFRKIMRFKNSLRNSD